jgi:hypothetical protein
MTIRLLFDTFAPPPPNGYGPRSAWTTWFAVATFFLAGFVAAHRTRQAGIGLLVASAASAIGNCLVVVATLVLFWTVIRHDAQMLRTFEMTGGWDETLFLPIATLPIVAAVGLLGGLCWLGSNSAVSHVRGRT